MSASYDQVALNLGLTSGNAAESQAVFANKSPSGPDPTQSAASARRIAVYCLSVAIPLALFCSMLAFAYRSDILDIPVAKAVNSLARESVLLDSFMHDLSLYALLTGVPLMALVWLCWFAAETRRDQAQILIWTLLAFPVGVLSRGMQHTLGTHARPYYDQAFAYLHPYKLGNVPFNSWDSFPSDHSTVYGALVLVVVLSRPKLAWVVVPWYVTFEFARIYMGAHYPSDLIGGLALASVMIFATRTDFAIKAGEWIMRLERSRPGLFYATAFLATYQIATLFSEFRDIVGGFTILKAFT